MRISWGYPIFLVLILVVWSVSVESFKTLYLAHWAEAVTMVFGAFVAGSTPLGGGAVAFPVLTKVLAFPASDAKTFSVLIQSVGMTCASVMFVSLKRKIYWKEIGLGLLMSVLLPNYLLSKVQLSNYIAHNIFTIFELIALLVIFFVPIKSIKAKQGEDKPKRYNLLCLFSMIGGLLTVSIGSGADLMLFIYLVLIRRICPVETIPSTVLFMALNSIFSALTVAHSGSVDTSIYSSWLAAVPIVAIAAPFGAWITSVINPRYILRFVVVLVFFDMYTTLLYGALHSIVFALVVIGSIVIAYPKFSTRSLGSLQSVTKQNRILRKLFNQV